MTIERGPRPYSLVVDSAHEDEPPPRYFGSLDTAWAAFDALDSRWKPFAAVRLKNPSGRGWYFPCIDRQGRVLA